MEKFIFRTKLKAMGINSAYMVGRKGTGKDKQGMYKNPKYKKYQANLRREIAIAFGNRNKFKGTVDVWIFHSYKTAHRRDCDGPLKGILDCLNKLVIEDDDQIRDIHIRIKRKTEDGIKIKVVSVDENVS